ncbi:MAG TPA: putative cytokinetic ring protein SteA [Thermoleophilaceae bacterium]|nr:putative cytokinetic ring protein SteA [Thermoleophilaceae bacterium]
MAAFPTAPPTDSERAAAAGEGETRSRRIEGTARLGRRTKQLARRLAPRDIAVIDHADLDRLSAEELVRSGVACVVNVAPSSSGRYPNEGPSILVDAGVHVVDAPGTPLFEELGDGEAVVVAGGRLSRARRVLAEGRVIDRRAAAHDLEHARAAIPTALEAFAANTIDHLRAEGGTLADDLELPELLTPFARRPALVVARGSGHERDLHALLPFVRERRPALVGVDGGADLLLAAGLEPDVIVGDMDSASDEALGSGAELLLHAYRDGRAPGRARLERLGRRYTTLPVPGTSEDAALLLAAEKGARPVVSIGSPFDMVDFLDRARDGMASSFLTRLRIGDALVEARGLATLLEP